MLESRACGERRCIGRHAFLHIWLSHTVSHPNLSELRSLHILHDTTAFYLCFRFRFCRGWPNEVPALEQMTISKSCGQRWKASLMARCLPFWARALTSYVAAGSPSPERPSTIAYLARCARLHSLAASGSPPVTMKKTPTDAEQAYVVSSAELQAGELSCISLACPGRNG